METRDQWYKPNLLYNIHYRPPKKPEPPKMIVETVQFNPSVCTCGEHGFQPQYRMEKRVLWTNKEECNETKQSKVNGREKKIEYKERKIEERITKQDTCRKIGSASENKQMVLKEENNQAIGVMIEGDGNKYSSAERIKEGISSEVESKSVYKPKYIVKEKVNVKIGGDDDDNNEKEEEKKEECVFKKEVGYRKSNGDICIDEEASSTYNTEEKNRSGRKASDNSAVRNSKWIYGESGIGNTSQSDFSNDCKWGESSKEHQIDKEQTTDEGDGAVDRNSASDVGEYCSAKRILNSDATAGYCSLESTDEGLQGVEIASAFGILSVYCNSELHSWMTFEDEDATKKIH